MTYGGSAAQPGAATNKYCNEYGQGHLYQDHLSLAYTVQPALYTHTFQYTSTIVAIRCT